MTVTSLRPPRRVANGNEIRRLRYELGLTIGQLAERAGLSRTHLSRVENGVLPGSPATLRKLATALGKTVTDITMVDARHDTG